MTIETATPEAQYEVRRRSVIAADATQRFANRVDPITAAQAADIDTALSALLTALTAAGFGAPVDPLVAQVANASTVPVKNSAGTAVPGTATATVAGSVLTAVNLPATVAPVTSGLLTPAATGTGTKVTLTVAGGVVTAVALSV